MAFGARSTWPPVASGPPSPSRLGLWLTMARGFGVDALAGLGLDWLGVDLQHGDLDIGDVAEIVRAADLEQLPVLIRVPSHDTALISRSVDAGAAGVIVPLVDSASQAAALVAAARLPPEGRRSSGMSRIGLRASYGSAPSTARPLLLPMIESAAGLAAVEEIAAVPGVDGLFVGPYDLALSIGAPGPRDQATLAAAGVVVAAARRNGLIAGAFAGDPALVEAFASMDLLAVDSDVGALRNGVQRLLEHARTQGEAAPGD